MTKVAEFKLNKMNSFLFNILAMVIFIVGLILIDLTPNRLLLLIKSHMFLSLLMPIIIVFAHEGMHALAYKMFGAKLKLGYKHLNIYLIDISGNLFSFRQITIIMLFPLLCLSAILLIAANIFTNYTTFLLLSALINISGSMGDILLLAYIMFKGKACWVKDEYNGFSLYKSKIPGSS